MLMLKSSQHPGRIGPMEEFGVRIRALRRKSGLTQRALASAAGVDFTYLSKIENGRLEHLPSVKTIRQLAAALHVFRRATETIQHPQEWRDLLEFLESRPVKRQ